MKVKCKKCGKIFRAGRWKKEAVCPACGLHYVFSYECNDGNKADDYWIDRIEEFDAMIDDYDGEGWL